MRPADKHGEVERGVPHSGLGRATRLATATLNVADSPTPSVCQWMTAVDSARLQLVQDLVQELSEASEQCQRRRRRSLSFRRLLRLAGDVPYRYSQPGSAAPWCTGLGRGAAVDSPGLP